MSKLSDWQENCFPEIDGIYQTKAHIDADVAAERERCAGGNNLEAMCEALRA